MSSAPSIAWETLPVYVRITAEFNRLPDGESKDHFSRAVEASFALDTTGRDPPRPKSAMDIQNEWGFTVAAQKKYGMALGKDAAWIGLLEPVNAPVNTYVYKQLTKTSYPERFGREPVMHNGKQMLLTVAEWLHFVRHEFSCPLPQAIQKHLR
jgi:hypothetical protein